MKTKLYKLLLLILTAFFVVVSCKGDEQLDSSNIVNLTLSQTTITLNKGVSEIVQITKGSGNYTVNSKNTSIATTSINGKEITIRGVSKGETTLVITDTNTSQTQTITVTVNDINTVGGNYPADQKIFVKGGTFQMGSNNGDSDEKPVHQVTVSNFEIGKYEVTNAQYAAFLNSEGNQTEAGYTWLGINVRECQIKQVNGSYQAKSGKENYPVIVVTWYGARAYAQWVGGRLPTEAEWEYAARGGNQTNNYTYSGSNSVGDVAWYSNSGSRAQEVGTKQANELGIHDMSGNVREWCNDWHGSYESGAQTNPQGLDSGSYRVLRGGSWFNSANFCRVAYRGADFPYNDSSDSGFRVVFLP